MRGSEGDRQEIERIERLAFRAWPAAEVQECDGWRLRFNSGVTHRANSLWPHRDGRTRSLQEKIEAAEAWYAARSRPAIVQLCPVSQPPQLDEALAHRGYTRGRDTAVQVAPLADVLARSNDAGFDVTVGDTCDDRWLATYRAAERVGPDDARRRAEIMQRIEPASAYAVAWSGETPCAVGSAAYEEGWAGIFNMATLPQYRRQGAARAVLHALATWARDLGGTGLYLQVMRENAPAWALYQRLGFSTLYGYYYRVQPSGEGETGSIR